jgi:hypothetical protein
MKRRTPLYGLIDKLRDERGGMALEASIVLPAFLFAILLLMLLIRLSTVQMALQDTAGQTVRLAAAHIRPAELAADAAAGGIPALPSLPQLPVGEIGPLAAELAGALPEPAGPLLEATLNGDWQPIIDAAATPIGQGAMTPLVRSLAPSSVLVKDRLRLDRLTLPDLQTREEPYLAVRLAYEVPLGLPFTRRTVTLTATAEERVWVGDAESAGTRNTGTGDAIDQQIAILAVEPTPLRPGRKAKVIAAGPPHAQLTLQVRYKSGTSRAKHLGEAVADANGIVEWEWHVSGNTTPGTWELVVSGPEGISVTHLFEVRKKGT